MKLAIASLAALLATPAMAATISWDFTNPSGNLGQTHHYTADGETITARGWFLSHGHYIGSTLWAKADGGDESGLGFGRGVDHEIQSGYFIDITVPDGLRSFTFSMGSSTQGEDWTVYGASEELNLPGVVLTPLLSGSDEAMHSLPGGYSDYVWTYGGAHSLGHDNVLLETFGATSFAAPEASTWLMLLTGFGGLGMAAMRRAARAKV